MSYLLDTNTCIALMRGPNSPSAQRYRDAVAARQTMAISSIVLFELEYGVRKSAHVEANETRVGTFLALFSVLPFTSEDARSAAALRATLERQKQHIGPFDTLIAGQALARKLTLVTSNAREFSRVPDLRWQDWATTAT